MRSLFTPGFCIYCKTRKKTYIQPGGNSVLCRRQTSSGLNSVTVSTKGVNSNDVRSMYVLLRLFSQAFTGRHIWKKIRKKYRLKEDGYLLLYAKEDVLFEQVMEYLPQFLEKKYASLAVVAVLKGMQVKVPKSGRQIQMVYLTPGELSALLRYYRLNSFFCHVIPISLKEPYGSYGLLRKDGIQLADLVRDYLMV